MYWFWIWDFVLSRLFEVLVSSVNREERTSVSAFLAAAYLHFFDIRNSNFALTPTRADTLYLVRLHNSIMFSLSFGEFFSLSLSSYMWLYLIFLEHYYYLNYSYLNQKMRLFQELFIKHTVKNVEVKCGSGCAFSLSHSRVGNQYQSLPALSKSNLINISLVPLLNYVRYLWYIFLRCCFLFSACRERKFWKWD